MRHVLKRMHDGLLLLSADGGRISRHISKCAREGTQAIPSDREGNLGNSHIGISQQGLGPFNASGQQISVRRNAEGLPEGSREVSL